MAGSSLFTLIDDIASILDDVAVLTKVAAKKTAGILGDDLALNAEQVSGTVANRELPVVWAVAKGSLKNKLILIPAALAISLLLPGAITPLLMLGGLFLCFEGCEKVLHKMLHSKHELEAEHEELVKTLSDENADVVEHEKEKVKGAIRTDFILSAEIIAITLGTVAKEPFGKQVTVLCAIGLLMTVGVYGLVAGIVKLDDLGLVLREKRGALVQAIGRGLLKLSPLLMKFLSIAGTVAVFTVGGGILAHGIPGFHHFVEPIEHGVEGVPGAGAVLKVVVPMAIEALVGVIAGAITVAIVLGIKKLRPSSKDVAH